MEVRCSSCSTEYEFDDALVSARGTSVKCTNCGHQFRVHAPAAAAGVAEKWIVRDARGKETTYTTLRELQQAIVKGLVDPKHEMSHGNQPFRPLQDIYELQTFFEAAKQRAVHQRLPPRTLLGVGRDAVKPVEGARPARQSVPPPRKSRTEPLAPARDLVTPVGGVPAVDAGGDTIRQPRVAQRALNEDLGGGDTIRQPRVRDDSHPHNDLHGIDGSRTPDGRGDSGTRPVPRANAAVPGTAGPGPARHSQPPGERLSHERLSQNPLEPPVIAAPAAPAHPWQQMQGLHDEPPSHITGSRGAGSKWIVAVLLLGTLALLGATVGRDYLVRFMRREPAQPVVDQRVPALLEEARTALLKGDFEKAHGELAKASVLAENEPAVATSIARLEVARTEPTWLRLRILGELEAAAAAKAQARKKRPSAAELTAEAEQEAKNALEKKQLELTFQNRMGQVRNAVSAAVLRAPDSPEAVRAKVDSLRLAGMVKDARALVGPIASSGTEPDTAYTLGALDLVESEAGLPSALDRLRTAARTEEGLGKARALLIYALAHSGDAAGADAELDKLQVIAPQHPALASLRSLVELAQSKASPEPEPPAVAATALPTAAPRQSSSSEEASSQLSQAAKLHREGDLDGAERLYQAVLSRNSRSIPALSGLGDIARQRHQATAAAGFYDQILKLNRNHVPTLMSRADLYWAAGNRILAAALYRRALAQVDHSDPTWQRAMTRIEEYEREGAVPTGQSGESTPSEAAPEAAPSTDGSEPPASAPSPEGSPPPSATPPSATPPAATPPSAPQRDSSEAPAPTRRRLPPIGGVPVTPGGAAPIQAPAPTPVNPAPATPPSEPRAPGPSLSQ